MYLRSEFNLPISSKWNSYSAANVDFSSALLGKAFQSRTDSYICLFALYVLAWFYIFYLTKFYGDFFLSF